MGGGAGIVVPASLCGGADGGLRHDAPVWTPTGNRDSDGAVEYKSTGGDVHWLRDGQLHRIHGDLPAVVKKNGLRKWYRNGKAVRNGDRPTIVSSDGACTWTDEEGRMHRPDGQPAHIDGARGFVEWRVHDKPHRDCGCADAHHGAGCEDPLPAAIHHSGQCEWYWHGIPYRPGGKPCLEAPGGVREWRNIFGKLHRLMGPALISPDGSQHFFIWGEECATMEEFYAERHKYRGSKH